MSSEIQRNGYCVRPTFNFCQRPGDVYTDSRIAAEMLESLRNLTEHQCRVIERIEKLLIRLDRRLAKNLPLRRES